MTTHFITAEIDLRMTCIPQVPATGTPLHGGVPDDYQQTPRQLQQSIEAELAKRGTPLRWAITEVDCQQQKAILEAIVTAPS